MDHAERVEKQAERATPKMREPSAAATTAAAHGIPVQGVAHGEAAPVKAPHERPPILAALRRQGQQPAGAGTIRRTLATADLAKAGKEADAAQVPAPTNGKLKNYVKDLYKGVRMNPRIGDGSCADAIRHELANPGAHVGGRGHIQKGREYKRGLENWLDRNPEASDEDKQIAQTIIDDLDSALKGDT